MKKHPQFVAANVSFEPPLKVRDSTETQAAKNEEAPVDDCAILISGRRILDASRTSPNTHTYRPADTRTHSQYYYITSTTTTTTTPSHTLPQPPNVEMAPKPRGLDDVERHQ